jgi:AraC-like DNA-binding protein
VVLPAEFAAALSGRQICLPQTPHNSTKRSATALSTWGLAIASALEARGCSSRQLFEQAGLDYAALGEPNARYPVSATTRLWRLAVEATGDPCFGIEVARHARFNHFHGLGFSLAASSSLREAFERIIRFFRLVTDAVHMHFEEHETELRLGADLSTDSEQPADEAIDAFVALGIRVCRVLRDRSFNPISVELRREAPPDPTPFLRYFRVMPTFGAAHDIVTFDRETFEAKLPTGNIEVARVNDAVITEHLARLEHSGVVSRLRKVLIEQLPLGEPSQKEIARRLGLSRRSLQRRLADEHLSYSQVLEQTRHELARDYVADAKYSITEIAYLLGFGTSTSFSRAFMRWTGEPPRIYRARLAGAQGVRRRRA